MSETPRMNVYLDTEFIENGKTIELLSIAMVREDGRELYWEAVWTNRQTANEWVKQNVIPFLKIAPHHKVIGRDAMVEEIMAFLEDIKPVFWGYYADYDWVVFCQLWGTMMQLPESFPKYCNDLKQLAGDTRLLPKVEGTEHHALHDARWVKKAYEFLNLGKGH